MDDAVRARQQETRRLFANSSYIWSSYVASNGTDLLPADCVNLPGMLGHVPAFLNLRHESDSSKVIFEETEYDNIRQLWASGSSVWRTTNGRCGLQKKIIQHRLLLGISFPSSLSFTADDRFRDWPGAENIDQPRRGNCIAILTLAWCYILSAKWVEMQTPIHLATEPGPMRLEGLVYLTDLAQVGAGDMAAFSSAVHVDLGDISDDAARWWAAILASETGWEASVVHSGQTYLSPWSIRIKTREKFILWRTGATSQERDLGATKATKEIPISSDLALQYLSEFCSHQEISSQCFAALATALLIPYQGRLHPLRLPKPHFEPLIRDVPLPSSKSSFQAQARLLPFYMSLSCNTQGIRPLLHGSFYEPSVPCNLVGSWLEGALKTIDPIIQRSDYSGLAIVMSKRRPRIAPIWLGAIILGIEHQILQPVRTGMFAIDMLSAAWTSTSHSFIGPRQQIPSKIDDSRISRADECRLLYIAQPDHSRVPVCPWEPFGDTDLQDADIEVRKHAYCTGKHCLQYEKWTWNLQNGRKTAADYGFIPNDDLMDTNGISSDLPVNPDCRDEPGASEGLAEIATRSIFSWLRPNGYPLNERAIWRHPWLNSHDSEDEDDLVESDTDCKRSSNIKKWILGCDDK